MPVKRTPPRFVPTLTEVVKPQVAELSSVAPAAAPDPEQLVQRVMQRVDLAFDRSLREAVATLVAEHAATLRPYLHEEIEAMVRKTVADVMAEERARRDNH
jgi:tRNA A37 N6-isopentenylltransferase MiaA